MPIQIVTTTSKASSKNAKDDKKNKESSKNSKRRIIESDDDDDDDDDSFIIDDDDEEDDDDDDDDYESTDEENYETVTEEDDEETEETEEELSPKKKKPAVVTKKSKKKAPEEKKTVQKKSTAVNEEKEKEKEKGKKKSKEATKTKKPVKSKKRVREEEEEEEDDDDEEDEYDSEDDSDYCTEDEEAEDASKGPGIILSFDAFGGGGGWNTDEVDYKEMIKQDKNEVCDSDDEKMFMKEQYVQLPSLQNTTESSMEEEEGDKKGKPNSKKKSKNGKSDKKQKKNDEKDECAQTVENQYAELSQLKKDLTEQLATKPNSKILKNAINECRQSIADLVKKERKQNTNEYYKLVSKGEEKRNTNELSYFKKKLSHKEQMKIMNDLTEINAFTNTDKPYRLALLESNIPPKFKAIALQKLNVLKTMEPSDSEYYKMKNWVDGFMRVPYGIYKNLDVKLSDGVDKCHAFIENAKTTLDECVYGLNDAKLQILQMVGQWISNPSAMGTAIAIKGPMGTGKTTLVKDGISKILGREFSFIALGGTGDSSFLEGHSYTYEGSSWGKIVSILMDSKCMNPVIYFDELDKISDTPKGEEITSILTHLTDTTQNAQYHDKYFSEVDFDVSKCLFIFSYNDESKVNPILKDRMYRIETKGYDSKEKVIISRKHLLPKIREQVNFSEDDVVIPDETLQYIIGNEQFSKGEQGVRNLKRCLEIIHTKLNLFRLMKPDTKMFENDMKIGEVKFPFTVQKKHVDTLIKSDDTINPSMMAMYV